eukprot:TRINITY_DN25158_c0_g1_i4.p1 TRINITY_DN25158_c0_g1~~TRINITY_DN25158_c0_g1_i4.p1  ORF type:complete len:378 (-),score=84.11 TRINITY_DN25158_c0_g1_i4:216-1349(-)
MGLQAALSMETLHDDSSSSTVELKALLFDRLAPMLVLKVIAVSEFGAVDDKSDLFRHLLARTSEALEFDQVRRVAAEILGRVPPRVSCKCLKLEMQRVDLLDPDGAAVFKAMLLACCHLSMNHGQAILDWIPDIADLVLSTLSLASTDQLPSGGSKLQLACIDTLAMFLQVEMSGDTASAGDSKSGIERRVLELFLSSQGLECMPSQSGTNLPIIPRSGDSTQTGMANVVTQVAKMAPLPTIDKLCRAFMGPMINRTRAAGEAIVRCACCQAVFNLAFRLSGGSTDGSCSAAASPELATWSPRLQELCVDLAAEPEEELRLSGLKLLGVILPTVHQGAGEWGRVGEKLAQSLIVAAKSDPAEAVRSLASQLLMIEPS